MGMGVGGGRTGSGPEEAANRLAMSEQSLGAKALFATSETPNEWVFHDEF